MYLCTVFRIARHISVFILVCFLPVITPKEYIHDLFGHEDTPDLYHPATIVEKAHKHCTILHFVFHSFVSLLKPFLAGEDPFQSLLTVASRSFIPGLSVNLSSLRAPPLSSH
jgi:hypothetical protein